MALIKKKKRTSLIRKISGRVVTLISWRHTVPIIIGFLLVLYSIELCSGDKKIESGNITTSFNEYGIGIEIIKYIDAPTNPHCFFELDGFNCYLKKGGSYTAHICLKNTGDENLYMFLYFHNYPKDMFIRYIDEKYVLNLTVVEGALKTSDNTCMPNPASKQRVSLTEGKMIINPSYYPDAELGIMLRPEEIYCARFAFVLLNDSKENVIEFETPFFGAFREGKYLDNGSIELYPLDGIGGISGRCKLHVNIVDCYTDSDCKQGECCIDYFCKHPLEKIYPWLLPITLICIVIVLLVVLRIMWKIY